MAKTLFIALSLLIPLQYCAHAQGTEAALHLREDRGQQAATSKVYDLKNAKSSDLAPFIEGAVKRAGQASSVMSVSSEGIERLVVTMPQHMVPSVDEMVLKLDKPSSAKDASGSTVQGTGITNGVYRPKYISGKSAAAMIDMISKEGGGSPAFYDAANNMVYWKGPASVERTVVEAMGKADAQGAGQLNYVNTDNDSTVVTKTYVLKNADPYEIRSVLLAAVRARRIDSAKTGVECVKYSDGKGAVVVSAESYRFQRQPGGMGIDELVGSLDQPGITHSGGDDMKLVFPQNIDAESAARMLHNSGLAHDKDPYELDAGGGKIRVDGALNGMLVKTSPSNMKSVDAAMKDYDKPAPEMLVRIQVYELGEESDERIGLDFKDWRDKAGTDIAAAGFGGAFPGIGEERTSYLNFSPRISSRYLDFLRASGKAGLMRFAQSVVRNGKAWALDIDSPDSCVDDTGLARLGLGTGFHAEMTPRIGDKGAALEVKLLNKCLLGFDANRKPRLHESRIETSLEIAGDGSRFVIGGFDNRTRVSSFDGDTEFLTKVAGAVEGGVRRTRLLSVLECIPILKTPKAGAKLE